MHFAMRKDQFKEYRKIVKKGEVDNTFLNNPVEKRFLKKFIKSNFIISGSIKNNEIIDKKKKNLDYYVMIISEYRTNLNKKKKKIIVNSLNVINNIFKKNNFKICIAPVSSRKEKIKKIFPKDEINFYEKNGLKFDYIFDQSYKLANRSKVIFCIDSNLGYELIAKKHKVFFLIPKIIFTLKNTLL